MVKVNIISGFLGAGKTTLIKKLLTGSVSKEKIILLENEYGEVGVDGSFMKDSGIIVDELNSGCICCTLVGDFQKAVDELIEKYHPDRLLIEPSGVGKLSEILVAVEHAKERHSDLVISGCATVVDAGKCRMYMKNFGEFFLDQIKTSATVIFSRTQLLSAERIEKSRALVEEQHPGVRIVTTPWDDLSADTLLEVIESGKPMEIHLDDDDDDDEDEHEHHHHHHHDHDHEDGETCSCGHHHDDDDDDDDDEHEHHHHHHHDHDHEDGTCPCCGGHHDDDDDDDDDDEHEHHHHHHDHDHEDGETCSCGHHHDDDDDDDDDEHEHHHHHHHDHDHEDGTCPCCGGHHDDDDDDDDDDEHEHHHHHHDHDHEDGETCSCGHHHHHHHGHDADEVFVSVGVETANRYEQDEVKAMLDKLSDEEEYGTVLRAKGILQNAAGEWFQFDYVPGESQFRAGTPDYTGRLCVIGAHIDEKALRELFKA